MASDEPHPDVLAYRFVSSRGCPEVHPRVLGAYFAVQGRGERPAGRREHHQRCVS